MRGTLILVTFYFLLSQVQSDPCLFQRGTGLSVSSCRVHQSHIGYHKLLLDTLTWRVSDYYSSKNFLIQLRLLFLWIFPCFLLPLSFASVSSSQPGGCDPIHREAGNIRYSHFDIIKITDWNSNEIILWVGVTTVWGVIINGHSIRKIENHRHSWFQ